jgi:hypothetical protein
LDFVFRALQKNEINNVKIRSQNELDKIHN